MWQRSFASAHKNKRFHYNKHDDTHVWLLSSHFSKQRAIRMNLQSPFGNREKGVACEFLVKYLFDSLTISHRRDKRNIRHAIVVLRGCAQISYSRAREAYTINVGRHTASSFSRFFFFMPMYTVYNILASVLYFITMIYDNRPVKCVFIAGLFLSRAYL